ncbi:polysaccharide pyruvyl transferase family protein [Olivibacter domesticus]|uniref:Polysaccharide pyruvyl transferase n=1 Tax=Olivibacter domesticus TaxID=407022 RepID=A0A1H7YVM1_OLID1|nr:polysaccharide pyruvyl transferase family protein [Olivibacter domesticus]SEM49418.1 Polysaccharide pyruvyl transferase [Olivibacter domesticus]
MNKILIIGAFDRFNYGDLLFPIIIEQQLKTYSSALDIEYFGIVESDLSSLGGKPTKSIQQFYESCESGTQRANIIVAGGESIAVTWHSLLVALNKKYKIIRRYQHHFEKFIDLNKFAKNILKGQTELPFVFNSDDFKSVDHVIFNSLGGSEIPDSIFKKVKGLRKKLQQVDYFSVRDKVTKGNMDRLDIPTKLFPDSAILMAKFYPNEVLETLVSADVKSYVEKNVGNYVFFQINRNHAKNQEEQIANQLNAIYNQTQTEICLCPIGKASNHNDDEALQKILPYLENTGHFFEEVNIWDIMYLIANSKCYIGTSLHGAITAMSYAVPYVGVNVTKLNSYLNTWGIDGIDKIVKIDSLSEQFNIAINISKEKLVQARDIQFQEIEKSFEYMKKLLMPD